MQIPDKRITGVFRFLNCQQDAITFHVPEAIHKSFVDKKTMKFHGNKLHLHQVEIWTQIMRLHDLFFFFCICGLFNFCILYSDVMKSHTRHNWPYLQ